MIEIFADEAIELVKNHNFLEPRDNYDRNLDNIETSYIFNNSADTNTHLKSQLNILNDDDFYTVVDKENITFGTTNRGSRELNMCGYTYQIKQETEVITKWRCVVRKPPCSVTIHTNNIDDSFCYWNGIYHHHLPDRNRELIRSLITKIKGRVLVEPHPVLFIAEEEVRTANLSKSELAHMPLPSYMGMFCIKQLMSSFF